VPQFAYKAKDTQGQLVTGLLEAESSANVIARLQTMGYFPMTVIDSREGGAAAAAAAASADAHTKHKRVKINDMASFNRQLADLLSSGIPLVKGLSVIQNQTTNPTLRMIITQITQDV